MEVSLLTFMKQMMMVLTLAVLLISTVAAVPMTITTTKDIIRETTNTTVDENGTNTADSQQAEIASREAIAMREQAETQAQLRERLDKKHVASRVAVRERSMNALLKRFRSLDNQTQNKLRSMNRTSQQRFKALSEEQLQRVVRLQDKQLRVFSELPSSRAQAYANLSDEELAKKLERIHIKKVKREDAFKKRHIDNERRRQARQRFENASKNYNISKQQFRQEQQAWKEAVAQGDDDAAIRHAKNYLSNATNLVINSLERLKAKIEANDDLTDEEASAAIKDIDQQIALMKQSQERVLAATTKEEVKAQGKNILDEWKQLRFRFALRSGELVKAQVGDVASRAEALENHLDNIVAQMEEQNATTDEIEEGIARFHESVALAREKLSQAQQLFKEAQQNNDQEQLRQARTMTKEAHEELRQAHNALMNLVRNVKAKGYDVANNNQYVTIIEEEDA